jgi:hypothetical protein
MDTSGMEQYASLMEEVKLRITVVDNILQGTTKLPLPPAVESVALQFRKVLELVAFASLIANKKAYASTYKDFSKEWNAKKLLQKLAKLNPQFYPVPVKQVKSDLPGIAWKHEKITDAYLTKDAFVDVYQACSELIHTPNPYGKVVDLASYMAKFPEWRAQIMRLLNLHELHLFNEPGMHVCSMMTAGTDKVLVYTFSPTGAITVEAKPQA